MLPNQIIHSYWKRRRYLRFTRHNERRFIIRLGKLISLLLILIMAHAAGMMTLEQMSFDDSLWLSITTVTTVGYGDLSASTWQGRVITTVFLYIFAISLLAQLAAEFFDYRLLIREKKINGLWRWKDMNDHLIIINTPNDHTEQYLHQLLQQIRATPVLEELPIQILTRKFDSGLPGSISSMGAVHYNGVAENTENLNAVNVATAKYIILIARDPGDPISDSLTFDVLNRIREIGTNALVIVEVSQDINRERMKKTGADVIIRPIRAYPELLVRSLVAPGTEQVLENLFTHEEDHMVRLNMEFSDITWAEIICRFVKGGVGVPMAFISEEGIDVNPLPDKICTGTGIITLINDTQEVTVAKAINCLS